MKKIAFLVFACLALTSTAAVARSGKWQDIETEPSIKFHGKVWTGLDIDYAWDHFDASNSCGNLDLKFNKRWRVPWQEQLVDYIKSGKMTTRIIRDDSHRRIWAKLKRNDSDGRLQVYNVLCDMSGNCSDYELGEKGQVICVRDDTEVVSDEKPQRGSGGAAVVPQLKLTRTDVGKAQEDAKRVADKADQINEANRKKSEEENRKIKQAEDEMRRAREDKHRQWCLAEPVRMSYCSCVKYSSVKMTSCQK